MSLPNLLADLPRLVRDAAADELPALLGRIAEAEAVVRMRLSAAAGSASTSGQERAEAEAERLLTPEQAAAVLTGVSRKWVLRHTKGLRFRRDLSRKVVRFEEGGLRRWAAARRA